MIEIVKIVNKEIKMSLRIKIGIHLKIKPEKHLMKEILKNKMNSSNILKEDKKFIITINMTNNIIIEIKITIRTKINIKETILNR